MTEQSPQPPNEADVVGITPPFQTLKRVVDWLMAAPNELDMLTAILAVNVVDSTEESRFNAAQIAVLQKTIEEFADILEIVGMLAGGLLDVPAEDTGELATFSLSARGKKLIDMMDNSSSSAEPAPASDVNPSTEPN